MICNLIEEMKPLKFWTSTYAQTDNPRMLVVVIVHAEDPAVVGPQEEEPVVEVGEIAYPVGVPVKTNMSLSYKIPSNLPLTV